MKLHRLLDLRGSIPSFVPVSHGKVHDVTVLDPLLIEPGAFPVMDRGYVDCARLLRFTRPSALFVTRGKWNLKYTRRSCRKSDQTTGLHCVTAAVPLIQSRIRHFLTATCLDAILSHLGITSTGRPHPQPTIIATQRA